MSHNLNDFLNSLYQATGLTKKAFVPNPAEAQNQQGEQQLQQLIQALPPEQQQQVMQQVQQIQQLPPTQQTQAIQQLTQQLQSQGGQSGGAVQTTGAQPGQDGADPTQGDPSQGDPSQGDPTSQVPPDPSQPGSMDPNQQQGQHAGPTDKQLGGGNLDNTKVTLTMRELLDITSGGKYSIGGAKVKTVLHKNKLDQMKAEREMKREEQKAQQEQAVQQQQQEIMAQQSASPGGAGGIYPQPMQQ